jgi:ubiquitin C-terminal hydrolase
MVTCYLNASLQALLACESVRKLLNNRGFVNLHPGKKIASLMEAAYREGKLDWNDKNAVLRYLDQNKEDGADSTDKLKQREVFMLIDWLLTFLDKIRIGSITELRAVAYWYAKLAQKLFNVFVVDAGAIPNRVLLNNMYETAVSCGKSELYDLVREVYFETVSLLPKEYGTGSKMAAFAVLPMRKYSLTHGDMVDDRGEYMHVLINVVKELSKDENLRKKRHLDKDTVDGWYVALCQSLDFLGEIESTPRQQDATEFLNILLSLITEFIEEIKAYSTNAEVSYPLPNLKVKDSTTVTCGHCGAVGEPYEVAAAVLNMPVQQYRKGSIPHNINKLSESFQCYQAPQEVVYKCSACNNTSKNAIQQHVIIPESTMVLELNRFEFMKDKNNADAGLTSKSGHTSFLDFEGKEFDYFPFSESTDNDFENQYYTSNFQEPQPIKLNHTVKYDEYLSYGEKIYELKAVVNHIGDTPESGHYTTEIRIANGQWQTIDDDQVLSTGGFKVSKNAYILIYELLLPDEKASLTEQGKLNDIVDMKSNGKEKASLTEQGKLNDIVDMKSNGKEKASFTEREELNGIVDMKSNGKEKGSFTEREELIGIVDMKSNGIKKASLTEQGKLNGIVDMKSNGKEKDLPHEQPLTSEIDFFINQSDLQDVINVKQKELEKDKGSDNRIKTSDRPSSSSNNVESSYNNTYRKVINEGGDEDEDDD